MMHGQDSERLPIFKLVIVTYNKVGATYRLTQPLRNQMHMTAILFTFGTCSLSTENNMERKFRLHHHQALAVMYLDRSLLARLLT